MRRLFQILLAALLIGGCPTPSPAQLYVTDREAGTISKYDAETGALIDGTFITGLRGPQSVTVADGALYVTEYGLGGIGKYDAKTGAAINAELITGLQFPQGLVVSGPFLYVSSRDEVRRDLGKIGKYDATTGKVIRSSLVSELHFPLDLVLAGNRLYVLLSSGEEGAVGEYDATTGATINSDFVPLVLSPNGMVAFGNSLLVTWSTGASVGGVYQYPMEGSPPGLSTQTLIPHLNHPTNLAISGNNLYVASFPLGTVAKYNATTGQLLNPNLITGLQFSITGLFAASPEPAAPLVDFHSDTWPEEIVRHFSDLLDYLVIAAVGILILVTTALYLVFHYQNQPKTPELTAKFKTVVAKIRKTRRKTPARRSTLVAVSGVDGCGKGYVTAQLARALEATGLRVATINVDGWLNLPSKRFDDTNPAEHFYLHGLRFEEMFAQLVLPLRDTRSVQVEVDHTEETATEYRKQEYDFEKIDIIILEGIFLLRRDLRHHYDLSIWIECSFDTALVRAIARAQEGLAPEQTLEAYRRIYFPAQKLHEQRDDPHAAADLIYLNDPKRSVAPAAKKKK